MRPGLRKAEQLRRRILDCPYATLTDAIDRPFYSVATTMPIPRTDVWIMFQQYQQARWVEEGEAPQGEPLGLRSGGVVQSSLGPWEFLFIAAVKVKKKPISPRASA